MMGGELPCAGGTGGVDSGMPIGRYGLRLHSTSEEVTSMSVLKLQNLQPVATNNSAAIVSLTSSSSTCCSVKPV